MRLVDVEPLFERAVELEAVALKQVRKYEPSENPIEWNRWSGILLERTAFKYDLMDAPRVDAVEVVRCKYCKHSEHWYGDKSRCFLWSETGIDVFEDGYCSYGKRREDE